jgi:plastocyanin
MTMKRLTMTMTMKRMHEAGGKTRSILVFAAFTSVAVLALIPLVANPRTPVREIVLETRNMAFYLEGSEVPNPTVIVRSGEEIRLTVRNRDPGITHALGIQALSASIDTLSPGSTKSLTLRVPDQPGRFEYVCPPHAEMMRGVLMVTN